MANLWDFLQFIGVSGLIVWLIQYLSKYFIDKRFETYKQELSEETEQFKHSLSQESEGYKHFLDTELERYRSELEVDLLKRTNIYERRLKLLSDLYTTLVDVEDFLKKLTAFLKPVEGANPQAQRRREIHSTITKIDELKALFTKNKIYLTEETCGLIQDFLNTSLDSFRDSTFRERWEISPSEYTQKIAKEADEAVRNDLAEVKEEIENNFREQLGSEEA